MPWGIVLGKQLSKAMPTVNRVLVLWHWLSAQLGNAEAQWFYGFFFGSGLGISSDSPSTPLIFVYRRIRRIEGVSCRVID
jgi:hypothetical protein